MIQKGSHKLFKQIHKLYNLVWKSGEIMNEWKTAKVIALYKSGDYHMASNFRPISITDILIRRLEKIIKSRMIKNLRFDDAQAGFRAKHHTNQHLLNIHETIHQTTTSNQHSICIFLDIKNAFDKLDPQMILFCMIKQHMTGNVLRFVNNFLTQRTMFTQLNNTKSKVCQVEAGTPQGSVLSPILFNLVIDKIGQIIAQTNGVDGCLFADDIAIFTPPTTNLKQATVNLQKALDDITMWSLQNRIKFSENKTKLVIFGDKKTTFKPKMAIMHFNIERVKMYKYLGIILQENGKHDLQFKATTKRLNWLVHLFNRLTQRNKNEIITLPTLKLLLVATMRATAAYGLPFLNYSEKQFNKLNTLLVRPIKRILNLRQDTGTLSLLNETNIIPFQLLQKQLTFNLCRSIFQNRAQNNSANKLLETLMMSDSPSYFIQRLRQIQSEMKTSYKDHSTKIKSHLLEQSYESWTKTYGNTRHGVNIGLREVLTQPTFPHHYHHDLPQNANTRLKWRFDRSNLNGNWLHFQKFKRNEECKACKIIIKKSIIETRRHALMECCLHQYARKELKMNLKAIDPNFKFNVRNILGKYKSPNTNKIKTTLVLTANFIQLIERNRKEFIENQ